MHLFWFFAEKNLADRGNIRPISCKFYQPQKLHIEHEALTPTVFEIQTSLEDASFY